MTEPENNQIPESEQGSTPASGKGASPKSKIIAIVICIVIVVILAAALFFGVSATGVQSSSSSSNSSSSSSSSSQSSSSTSSSESEEDSDTGYLGLRVKVDGIDDDTAAPAIAHVSGVSDAGEAVDKYAALQSSGTTKIELPVGTYTVDMIGAINEDGSMFTVPESFTAKINANGIAAASVKLTFKAGKEISADEIQAAAATTVAAVEASNGDIDAVIAERAQNNAANNPNVG